MADVQITVRGSSEATHPPERATVHLGVDIDGPERERVFEAASSTASSIAAEIDPLFDRERGPVTWWSSDQVRTWWDRPWNKEGRQLAPVHHAGVAFQVTFADFSELSRWLGAIASLDGVSVRVIEWTLTETLHTDLVERTRDAAVQDARAKAAAYARSMGLGEVRPVALADPGMLVDARAGGFVEREASMAGRPAPGRSEIALTPQHVVIRCSVDARFLA